MKRLLALLVLALTLPSVAALPALGQDGGTEVRIVRDGYGVPHVYSDTLDGVGYGAGYAIAQDRLFQLEVLRSLAKGRFTELWGPVPGFPEMDASSRLLFYTDEERRAKFERLPDDLKGMYLAFVDGINAWMEEVRNDPSKLPFEFTQLGIGQPEAWDVTDSIAIADYLVETFGAGGGTELEQQALLDHLIGQYGEEEGTAAFDDIRWLNDPASPVSIPRDYDWESEPSRARELPAKRWREDARLGLSEDDRAPLGPAAGAGGDGEAAIGTLAQEALVPDEPSEESLEQLRRVQQGVEDTRRYFSFGSNAAIVGPQRTEAGGTLELGGPQVGHYTPEIIAEFGLHSPENGLDVVGLTFAGAGPIVLIGRGPDYAFTTTTGNSDGADVYVEQLGEPAEDGTPTYVYDGRTYKMDCRGETINTRGGVPYETFEVCRTRNGPVLAMDEENGVAYAIRRSWFDMETGTFNGFAGYNFVDSLEDFATAANLLQSNHNMFYVDADGNYGYWHPGALPIRAEGTDVRLPQDGSSSAADWRRLRTAEEVPHAVNFPRGWLANWNNKPAVSWDNGDGANYGGVFRSHLWDTLLEADDSMTFTDLEDLNRINGTTELEIDFFRDHVVRAGRASDDEQVREAAEVLAAWDGRREDTDDDDLVDSEPGYSLWKGWLDHALPLAFEDDLGDLAGRASDSMLLHVLDGADASLAKSRDWLNGEDVDTFLNRVMRANLDALGEEYGTDDMSAWQAPMPKQHYLRLNARFYDCEVGAAAGTTAGCDSPLPGNVPDLDYMNRGTYNHIVEHRPLEVGAGNVDDQGEVEDTTVLSTAATSALPATGGGAALLGIGLVAVAGLLADRRRVLVVAGVAVLLAAAALPITAGSESIVEDRGTYEVEAESIISPGQSGFISPTGQEDPHYADQHELYGSWAYKPMPLRQEDVEALGDGEVTTLTYRPPP